MTRYISKAERAGIRKKEKNDKIHLIIINLSVLRVLLFKKG
jgi:hypothetical protein